MEKKEFIEEIKNSPETKNAFIRTLKGLGDEGHFKDEKDPNKVLNALDEKGLLGDLSEAVHDIKNETKNIKNSSPDIDEKGVSEKLKGSFKYESSIALFSDTINERTPKNDAPSIKPKEAPANPSEVSVKLREEHTKEITEKLRFYGVAENYNCDKEEIKPKDMEKLQKDITEIQGFSKNRVASDFDAHIALMGNLKNNGLVDSNLPNQDQAKKDALHIANSLDSDVKNYNSPPSTTEDPKQDKRAALSLQPK